MSFIDRFFMIGPPDVLVSTVSFGLFSLTTSWMTRRFFFILDSSGGRLLKTKTSGESNILVVDPYLPDVKMTSLNSSRILCRWSVHSWFGDSHMFNMTIGSGDAFVGRCASRAVRLSVCLPCGFPDAGICS